MNINSLPSSPLTDVLEICPQAGLSLQPSIPLQEPESAFRAQFEALYQLLGHLLPNDQLRLGARQMGYDEVLDKVFSESDILDLLDDSILGLEILDQALVTVNAKFSLRREQNEDDNAIILPVVLSLANHLAGKIPADLSYFVTLANKRHTVREPIPEWSMIAPFCNPVIRTDRLPEMMDYLLRSPSEQTQKMVKDWQSRMNNLGVDVKRAECNNDEKTFNEKTAQLHAITKKIEALFISEDFNDVSPENLPDIIAKLGVVIRPNPEILGHAIDLVVAMDKLLVAAICSPENGTLQPLPIPFLRADGIADSFMIQVVPAVLRSPGQPLNAWLDVYMRLREVVGSLRTLAEGVESDTATRLKYLAVLRPLGIPVFGSHPELLQNTVTRLMEIAAGNPEMEDSLLNVFCTPARLGMNGERAVVPIVDYPSNLPILIWMIPLVMSRDDFGAGVIDRALRDGDSELFTFLNFCKACTRSGKYGALAGRLTSEIDKALGDGVREMRKAVLVLVLDWLITNDEVRRTLKNLIPRVGDLRKMVAGISSLNAVNPIQPALDRVTMGLTPNLEDYFGQEALKLRVNRMISAFLHVAEDTTRLRGRKPCEVVKNGLLLPGPPGGGKTFFMDCLMNTLGLQCFVVSPEKAAASDRAADRLLTQESLVDLLDKKISEAEAYIRRHNKPCILKLDEFEQFCLDRRQFKDHFEQTNRALTLIERLRANPRIFLVAATNHLDFVDEAMRRVGRFDVVRAIGFPDAEAARRIIAGTVFPYPEISLTSDQYAELANIAANGQLIPLSIIQTLTADLMVTGKAPAFEALKTAMLETVEDRRISSGRDEPMAA